MPTAMPKPAAAKTWDVLLIEQLQQILADPATIIRFRVSPTDWTRQRTLTFPLVVLLILRAHKQALQITLNKLFTALGAVRAVTTASALCQARQKLRPELFLHLNSVLVEHFYQLPSVDVDPARTPAPARTPGTAQAVWRWQGHRVLGLDGTRWNLPDTLANRDHFGCATNQHAGFCCAQAQGSILQGSILYDVLNDIGLNAVLEPIQSEKALLFKHHLEHTQEGDVIVMDRCYADYSVLAFWVRHQRAVVVRLPRSSFGIARAFWASDQREQIVTLHVTPSQRAFVREHGLPTSLQVRLVKLTLDNGQVEVLLTTLVDTQRYPAAALGQVYAWRWRLESYLDRLKNIFEIERLGSLRREPLAQDFYGVLFLATLDSVLTRPADQELQQGSRRRGCRCVAQVNRAVSYSALLDHTLELLLGQGRSAQAVLEDVRHLLKQTPVRRRLGRHYAHDPTTPSEKLRFHRYTKRALT